MTDRELLERAARAIGATEYGGPDDCRPAGVVLLNSMPRCYEGNGEFGFAWNPLHDDGDALRLAMSLRMRIEIGDVFTEAVCGGAGIYRGYAGPASIERNGDDPSAATRRAIVRAAAAMAPEVAV